MSNTRKMLLLDQAEVERLRQRQLKEYDPTLGAMARATMEIEEVLSNRNLTDEDKLQLLGTLQERFRKLKATLGPVPVVSPVVVAPPAVAAPTVDAQPVEDEDVQYAKIKETLDRYGHVLRPSKQGELVFRNKTVPGSSYHQIMNAVLTGEQFDLPGFQEFIQGLNIVHVPRTLFKNEKFLEHLEGAAPAPVKAEVPAAPKTGKKQKGKGSTHPPPGKRPHIIWLYH